MSLRSEVDNAGFEPSRYRGYKETCTLESGAGMTGFVPQDGGEAYGIS